MKTYSYRRRHIQGRWSYAEVQAETLYDAQMQVPRVKVYDMTTQELKTMLKDDEQDICPGSVSSEFIRRRANG